MVAIHSVPEWDLYVVYEGINPDTGQPIIKAYLNPLVGWIWIGWVVMVLGSIVALFPSLSPLHRVVARAGGISGHTCGSAERRRLMRGNGWKWLKAAQALALGIAICFTLGATDAGSRFNDLGHRMVCPCGCAQLLGECNHVGCPDFRPHAERACGLHP